MQTAIAHTGDVADVYETTGTIRSRTTSNLASKVVGNVTRVLVREGDSVRRGELLIEIDSAEAASMLEKARAGSVASDRALDAAAAGENAATAQADLAQTTYERMRMLREKGHISAHDFDQADAQRKAAAADLERARAVHQQLVSQRAAAKADVVTATTFAGYSEIRAPIDGVVTARHADAGSQAAPGMVLMTVEDPANVQIDVFVPDEVAPRIHTGDPADIDLGTSVIQRARVAQVVPALDPSTRTALIKLDVVAGTPPTLRPGQAARVRLTVGSRRALVVPDSAIRTRGQLRSVYIAGNDAIMTMRLVTTGRSFAGSTEILSGIEDGERFVTSATPEIRDGAQIANTGNGSTTGKTAQATAVADARTGAKP